MKTSASALIIKTPMKMSTKNSSRSVSLVMSRTRRTQKAMTRVIFSEVIMLIPLFSDERWFSSLHALFPESGFFLLMPG